MRKFFHKKKMLHKFSSHFCKLVDKFSAIIFANFAKAVSFMGALSLVYIQYKRNAMFGQLSMTQHMLGPLSNSFCQHHAVRAGEGCGVPREEGELAEKGKKKRVGVEKE